MKNFCNLKTGLINSVMIFIFLLFSLVSCSTTKKTISKPKKIESQFMKSRLKKNSQEQIVPNHAYKPKEINFKKDKKQQVQPTYPHPKKKNKFHRKTLVFKADILEKLKDENIFADSLLSKHSEKTNEAISIHNLTDYPSPSSVNSNVRFEILKDDDVTFELFNEKGDLVGKKIYPKLKKGIYEIYIILRKIKSGIYYYLLKDSNTQTKLKKIALMK